MKNIALALIAAAALVACAPTTGSSPRVSHSGFDDAKVVTINGHGNACANMVCTGLGAQWRSNKAEQTILTVHVFNHMTAITGAELNIDGKKYDLRDMQAVTDLSGSSGLMQESRKGFTVPLALIRKITTSKRTWLRVHTPSGHLEDAVIDGQTESKAYHALKRFLVEAESATPKTE